jgi:hypothetical protein
VLLIGTVLVVLLALPNPGPVRDFGKLIPAPEGK